jgi:hypothetical protein
MGSEKSESLPPSGSIIPNPSAGEDVMIITASYTDNGEENVKPLTGSSSVILQQTTAPISFKDKD